MKLVRLFYVRPLTVYQADGAAKTFDLRNDPIQNVQMLQASP